MIVLDIRRVGAGYQVMLAHRGAVYEMPLEVAPTEAVRAWLDEQQDGLGALGGVLEELQAAARPKVTEWVQVLGRMAVEAQRQRDEFRRLRNTPKSLPLEVRHQLEAEANSADQRARNLLTVRDWVYETAGYAADLDTGDARSTRGLGAVQIGAAGVAAVTAIIGSLTLAGFIAWQVRIADQTRARLESYQLSADKYAAAKTPQEREAHGQALRQMGEAVIEDAKGGDGVDVAGGVAKVLTTMALVAGVWGVSRLLRFRDARSAQRR